MDLIEEITSAGYYVTEKFIDIFEVTTVTIIFRDQNNDLRQSTLLSWLTPGQVEYYSDYPKIAQDLINNINDRYEAERNEIGES